MMWFLCIGVDTLDDACPYETKAEALATFRDVAEGLARFGQPVTGTLHMAAMRDALVEDPDWALSLGPRGGVRCERC